MNQPPRIEVIGSGIDGINGYYKITGRYSNMPWYDHEKSEASIYYLCGWNIIDKNKHETLFEIKYEDPYTTTYSQRTRLPPTEGSKWKNCRFPYKYFKGYIKYHWK